MEIDRKAFRSLSSGLYIISSIDADGRLCGCVVNTLLQVASDPAQLLVSINKQNATANAVSTSKRFCASVLSQDTTMDLIGTFGFKSSKDIDKFSEFDHDICESGLPRLTHDTLATFEVSVDSTIDVGTHLVFIGTVKSAEVVGEGTPITYDYYHRVLRGKTPRPPRTTMATTRQRTRSSRSRRRHPRSKRSHGAARCAAIPSKAIRTAFPKTGAAPCAAWDATTSRRCSSSRSFQTRMRALAASAHAITI